MKTFKLKSGIFLKANEAKKLMKLSAGFTLIELLTAIAVIGIVSSFVLVNLNTGKKQKDIQRAAQKLQLDIRRAQNLSLSPSGSNVCVYGLKINSAADYFIYHNDGDCAAVGRSYGGSSTKEGGNIAIGNNILASFGPSMDDVSFEAPEPIVYFNGALAVGDLTITLSNSSCPACTPKKVVVNRFGQVEMQ